MLKLPGALQLGTEIFGSFVPLYLRAGWWRGHTINVTTHLLALICLNLNAHEPDSPALQSGWRGAPAVGEVCSRLIHYVCRSLADYSEYFTEKDICCKLSNSSSGRSVEWRTRAERGGEGRCEETISTLSRPSWHSESFGPQSCSYSGQGLILSLLPQ